MEKVKDYTHISVKDKNGVDYLCPVELKTKNGDLKSLDVNVCFEKDVPERYAGRIVIKES